jgi:hypothetical protein
MEQHAVSMSREIISTLGCPTGTGADTIDTGGDASMALIASEATPSSGASPELRV